MSNKNYGKILLSKTVIVPDEEASALKGAPWSGGDTLSLGQMPRLTLSEGDIVGNNQSVKIDATISSVNVIHGLAEQVRLYAFPFDYNVAITMELEDQYLFDSQLYYSHTTDYTFLDSNMPLDLTPQLYTFIGVIVDNNNKLAEYETLPIKLTKEIVVNGISLESNLLEMQNVVVSGNDTLDGIDDIDHIGYQNTPTISNPSVTLSWSSILDIQQDIDYGEGVYGIENRWVNTFGNYQTVRPETIQTKFQYYVIYIYTSDGEFHPKTRRPQNVNFDISPDPTIKEENGEWTYYGNTLSRTVTMDIPFDKNVAIWIGVKFKKDQPLSVKVINEL